MARAAQKTREVDGPLRLFKKSFSLYRARFLSFFLLGVIAFAVGGIQFLAIYFHSLSLFIASVIASVVVSYIVYLAMIRIASAPGTMSAGLALSRVEQFVIPSVWVSFVMMLVVLGSSVLFIIPGIIVTVFIIFSLFAVIVEHCQQMDALLHSWQIVKGRWLQVFYKIFVGAIIIGFISWAIIGLCWLFGIGETPVETIRRTAAGDFSLSMTQSLINQFVANVFSLPLAILFLSVLYEQLRRTNHATFTPVHMAAVKKYVRIFAILGILCLIGGLFFSSLRFLQVIPELIKVTHAPAAIFSAF